LSGIDVRKVDDFSAMELAFELATMIEHLPSLTSRSVAGSQAASVLSPEHAATKFLNILAEDSQVDEKSYRRTGLATFIKTCQVPITYKDARDVLMKCEELKEYAATCELEHFSEILRIRGDALVALARADEAILSFEQSLKANQSNFHALRGLGYLAWHGHSHEDALSFFKRGLAVNPNDYQCLVGVGLVYRRLKMFDESVFWLHKAVAIGGPESPSMSLLVQACLENPDAPEALHALKVLRDSVGDHPNLVTAIGKLESHQ
jgi:tetratricopeptide (TPR) repeat protein